MVIEIGPIVRNVIDCDVREPIAVVMDSIDYSCLRFYEKSIFNKILPVIFVRDPIITSIRKDIENDNN